MPRNRRRHPPRVDPEAKSNPVDKAAEVLGTIFDMFTQLDNPTSSARTREVEATHAALLVDLAEGHYFANAG